MSSRRVTPVDAARGVTARPRVGTIDRRVSGSVVMDAEDAEENIVVVVAVVA